MSTHTDMIWKLNLNKWNIRLEVQKIKWKKPSHTAKGHFKMITPIRKR